MKEQLAALVEAVAVLTKEVHSLKEAKGSLVQRSGDVVSDVPVKDNTIGNEKSERENTNRRNENSSNTVWNDQSRTNEMKKKLKFTVCIKSNEGAEIDSEQIKNIVTTHGIKVTKASVNKNNNDLYVDLPSDEQRQKLIPLLSEEVIPGNRIINVKEKYPTISIRGVEDYTSEADLITRIKVQNVEIKEKLEAGSHFSVVFSKEHKKGDLRENGQPKEFLIVARVSDDIRSVINANGNKIFLGFNSHLVVDRFYVRSCSKCHKFGHYHADCTSNQICGYCCSENHDSQNCPIHREKNCARYKCTNCEALGKVSEGHSSHWHKCPALLEVQKKIMRNIPYYAKNEKSRDCQNQERS